MKRVSLGSQVLVFAAVTTALSLGVGFVRSWVRFSLGTLPNQYLAHSAVINAVLFLMLSMACVPVLICIEALRRRAGGRWLVDRPRVALFAGFALAFLFFWVFNTGVGFRVLREAFHGHPEPVLAELASWLPGMVVFVIVAMALCARASVALVLRRAAWVLLGAVLGVAGLRAYSYLTDPSIADPLGFEASARRKPDVFLVLVDTLRADHLGVYGYSKPTSPNVDALASEGTVYEQTYAPAPWTRPSCGALLTSRYPPEIGLDGLFSALPKPIPILPQLMKNEGYRTAGIVSSVHLSAQFGFDKGWDVLDIGTTYLQWTGTKTAFCRLGLVPWGETYPRYNARELTDRAIDWLDKTREASAAPVFMYLHYSDPHAPYRPPADSDRWRDFARPEVRKAVADPPFSPTWGHRELSELEVEAMVARYDAEIAFFDQEFERFLQHLREIGIYDRSVILVTADHGEEFADHGGWTHAHSLYNELIHVPLIIKYPARWGIGEGRREGALASLVDVVPTIRDLLGSRWPESLIRGRSLLRDDLEEDDYAVYSKADSPLLRALVRGPDKLIQRMQGDQVVGEQYFSLVKDFSERGDGKLPDDFDLGRLVQMRTTLARIDSRSAGVGRREISLDAETKKELKALGYLGD